MSIKFRQVCPLHDSFWFALIQHHDKISEDYQNTKSYIADYKTIT